MNRQTLTRILFINELYKKIINMHGVIVKFGVRRGQNLALFESFRGMYEPYNYNRKIIGFDELNCHAFPGGTIALKEVLGLNKYKIHRNPLNPLSSYIMID